LKDFSDQAGKLLIDSVMRGYPVYKVNRGDRTVMRTGSIIELRKDHTEFNRLLLMKLARKVFGESPGEIVFLGPVLPAASADDRSDFADMPFSNDAPSINDPMGRLEKESLEWRLEQ
jgi:hypothetical protein